MSWSNTRLADVCEINIGKTPARANQKYWGDGHPWMSIRDMNQGRELTNSKEQITDAAIRESGIKLVTAGTILFSFKLSIGKVGITQRDLFTNEAIAALPIKDDTILCTDYLFHALQSIDATRSSDRAVMGATLNKKKLAELKIPLPPLREQKRIATILDKADAIRRKRQQAIELADQLLRSVFLDMFGDPVTNPMGWPKIPISEIGQVITGNTPSRKVPEFYGNHIEWIKSDNINTPYHYLTRAEEYLSEQGLTVARSVPSGSLLVTCIAGSKNCIGNIAIANRTVTFNQQINAIVPNERTNLLFVYAQLLYNKKLVRAASTESMKGMVNKSKFSAINLIAPDATIQNHFSEIFKESLEWTAKQEKFMLESTNCSMSLTQQAFNGELSDKEAA